jgi:excisionase family DNA binding protein
MKDNHESTITLSTLLQQTEDWVTAHDADDRAERRQQLLAWMEGEVETEDEKPSSAQPPQGSTSSRPLNDVVFLTVAETASVMRVSKMTVYRLVHSGHLPAIRVGRSFRVPEQAVREFLQESYVFEAVSSV